jgi:outer membrane protein TolC
VIPVARAGFTKAFYSGANLSVEFLNNMLFEYDGAGFQTVGTSITTNFSQPLLRGALARNVTQPLSLLERAMLYAVRDFAHYRRSLYVETVAGSGYLGLLQQTQAIRNAEENLASLKRNLEETEALVRANFKSQSERDQVALSYQQAQVALLSQEANLETTLDAFRVELGLPPGGDPADRQRRALPLAAPDRPGTVA